MLVINPDGTSHEMTLPEGQKGWRFEELQVVVGGYLQELRCVDRHKMLLVDEDGKLKRKPINRAASLLYPYGQQDPLCGVVLVCTRAELDDGEEDE